MCGNLKTVQSFATYFGPYYTIFIVFTAHSVFFLASISMTWSSPVLPKLFAMEDNPLRRTITPDESDLIGSLLYVGAAIGPLLVFDFVTKIGKKTVLVLLSSIMPVTYTILMFTQEVEMYYFCRIFQGVYIGAALSIQPVYLSDILLKEERGYLMSFGTAFGYIGMMVSYAVGPYIPMLYFNGLIAILSSIFTVLLMIGCPESPYYTMQNKGENETRVVLKTIRKTDIEYELYEMEQLLGHHIETSHFEIFKSVKYLKYFFFATIPLLIQASSGGATIQTYTESIFLETNMNISSSLCSIIIGCFNFVTVFLTPLLIKLNCTMKSLLILCLSGIFFSNITLSFYFYFCKNNDFLNWLPLFALVVFVPFYNCGMDPIPWIVLAQVYPKNVEALGTALSTTVYCLCVFVTLFLFSKVSIGGLFLASGCVCILGILYCTYIFYEPGARSNLED